MPLNETLLFFTPGVCFQELEMWHLYNCVIHSIVHKHFV